MTPREYFDEVCRPSVDEFRAAPTSVRHAWSAAAALFHFRDWLANYRGVNASVVHADLVAGFPRFQALADIANAGKHFELDRGPRAGLSARDFRIGRGAAFSDGSYYSDGTSHSDAPNVIRMEFQGERIDVLHLCEQALAYLQTKT